MAERAIDKLHQRMRKVHTTPSGISVQLRNSLARALSKKLKELGWSQKRLADEMQCHPPYVSDLLHGEANFTVNQAAKALHAVGIKSAAIIDWNDVGVIPASASVVLYQSSTRNVRHDQEERSGDTIEVTQNEPCLRWRDAHLIAFARTDLPACVAEIRRLKAKVIELGGDPHD